MSSITITTDQLEALLTKAVTAAVAAANAAAPKTRAKPRAGAGDAPKKTRVRSNYSISGGVCQTVTNRPELTFKPITETQAQDIQAVFAAKATGAKPSKTNIALADLSHTTWVGKATLAEICEVLDGVDAVKGLGYGAVSYIFQAIGLLDELIDACHERATAKSSSDTEKKSTRGISGTTHFAAHLHSFLKPMGDPDRPLYPEVELNDDDNRDSLTQALQALYDADYLCRANGGESLRLKPDGTENKGAPGAPAKNAAFNLLSAELQASWKAAKVKCPTKSKNPAGRLITLAGDECAAARALFIDSIAEIVDYAITNELIVPDEE
jgi:hypothetical protein